MTWFRSLLGLFGSHRKPSRSGVEGRSRRLQITELEPRVLLASYHLDFGTSSSPVASGYVSSPVAGYSSSSGRGWVDASSVMAVVRKSGTAATRDFLAGKDATYRIDVPNGTYLVTPTLGDTNTFRDHTDIYINGNKVASDITVPMGRSYSPTYSVKVTDGKLTLRLVDHGGKTVRFSIDAMDVVSTTSADPVPTAGPDQYANVGQAVAFKGTATGSGTLTYAWNFGDGKSATGTLTPKHTYTDDGTYTVTLTVKDSQGRTGQATMKVIVKNDSPLRANHLGTYKGIAGQALSFAGVARDNDSVDQAYGFTYSWNFGDGSTATGAAVKHTYESAGTYTVTLTVTGLNGVKVSTKTTATISEPASAPSANDFRTLSANLLGNTAYDNLKWTDQMASSGAWGVNADWEQGKSSKWYIEQQRNGEALIIDGLLHKDTNAIAAGFKAFDWGFKHQASDGSFKGTEDAFHSTSFFVAAVARACLLIQQSPYASQYQSKVDAYTDKVYKAALWMAKSDVWSNGIKNDAPYTHRRYLVAAAMGLTSRLVGGNSTLMNLARSQIKDALSRQLDNGVNPEAGGYDSSYQNVGISYAQLWAMYFPKETTTSAVKTMISKAVAWEASRILSDGKISTDGNTRTGVETGINGSVKTVDWRSAVNAFAWEAKTSGNTQWAKTAQKIAEYYYKCY
jgi:PKD repeat protein